MKSVSSPTDVSSFRSKSPVAQDLVDSGQVSIACILWGEKYPVGYVERLFSAMRKHLSLPLPFYCITDNPAQFGTNALAQGIQLIAAPNSYFGWWQKINLFDPRLLRTRYVIYCDVDTVVLKNVDFIFDYLGKAELVYAQDLLDPMSSSMMIIDTASRLSQDIVAEFRYEDYRSADPGDQAYLERFVRSSAYSTLGLRAEHHYSYKFLIDHSDWRVRNRNPNYRVVDFSEISTLNFHGEPNPHHLLSAPDKWQFSEEILRNW
jgi:hypothetical protein